MQNLHSTESLQVGQPRPYRVGPRSRRRLCLRLPSLLGVRLWGLGPSGVDRCCGRQLEILGICFRCWRLIIAATKIMGENSHKY